MYNNIYLYTFIDGRFYYDPLYVANNIWKARTFKKWLHYVWTCIRTCTSCISNPYACVSSDLHIVFHLIQIVLRKADKYVRGSYTPAWWRNATHKCESAPTAPPCGWPLSLWSHCRFVNPVRKMLPSSWYRCEAFNSLMREQNIFSNRRAPSHDNYIAVSSGYYQSETNGDFQQWVLC